MPVYTIERPIFRSAFLYEACFCKPWVSVLLNENLGGLAVYYYYVYALGYVYAYH